MPRGHCAPSKKGLESCKVSRGAYRSTAPIPGWPTEDVETPREELPRSKSCSNLL